MTPRTVLVHIGYPKTGSTALQKHFFRPDFGFHRPYSHGELAEHLIFPHPLDFDPTLMGADIGQLISGEALLPVLSHERLVGNPISGGYDVLTIRDRVAQLLRNRNYAPKIFIVVREQRSLALSSYQQFVREGGCGSLAHYLQPPTGAKLPLFHKTFLQYDRTAAAYMEVFGRDNVLVLPFELLRGEPNDFLNRLLHFVGLPDRPGIRLPRGVNRATNPLGTLIRSSTNRFFYRDNCNPTAPFRLESPNRLVEYLTSFLPRRIGWIESYWRTRTDQLLGGSYEASNRRLQDLIGIDLSTYGYMT